MEKVGGEAGELAKDTAKGTLDAADDIGSKAGGIAKKAATNTAALPHDVIESAKTGKPEEQLEAEAAEIRDGLRRAGSGGRQLLGNRRDTRRAARPGGIG